LRRGIDSNVLIYAHVPSLKAHSAVRSFLLRQLADSHTQLAITPAILHEFVHIVTDARRFEPPVSMSEAIALSRGFVGRANIECLSTDEAALYLALELMQQHRLGRNRLADTLFAATLLANDVHELITCNPADYRIFSTLRLIDPRGIL
jgi:predicted nucleic acid-binding protein